MENDCQRVEPKSRRMNYFKEISQAPRPLPYRPWALAVGIRNEPLLKADKEVPPDLRE
jgi:hypothetical protein